MRIEFILDRRNSFLPIPLSRAQFHDDPRSVPLSGAASDLCYVSDDKQHNAPHAHITSEVTYIPSSPPQIRNAPIDFAHGNSFHPFSPDHMTTFGEYSPLTRLKDTPPPSLVARPFNSPDVPYSSCTHNSPLDYYAAFPLQTFLTPSELLNILDLLLFFH